MDEIEKKAERAAVTGYHIEDLSDTPIAMRDHPYNLLFPHKGAWARFMRKILDSKAIPQLP